MQWGDYFVTFFRELAENNEHTYAGVQLAASNSRSSEYQYNYCCGVSLSSTTVSTASVLIDAASQRHDESNNRTDRPLDILL